MYKGLYQRGDTLPMQLQREAQNCYRHRMTGEHQPSWIMGSSGKMQNGEAYKLQFADDRDWLANTYFPVSRKQPTRLREGDCYSHPTWPNNPELRKENSQENVKEMHLDWDC